MSESIVKDIEDKIETLKKVRSLLTENDSRKVSGDASLVAYSTIHRYPDEPDVTQKKRVMSAEGRANIAAAQRKRWGKRA